MPFFRYISFLAGLGSDLLASVDPRVLDESARMLSPFLSSSVFAVLTGLSTGFLAAIFGLFASARLVRLLLPVGVLTALAGAQCQALGFKLLAFHWSWMPLALLDREPLATWGFALILQIAQFTPLFASFVALRLSSDRERRCIQREASLIPCDENERPYYLLWPRIAPTLALLTLLATAAALTEDLKLHVLLRPSPGSGFELGPHALSRAAATLLDSGWSLSKNFVLFFGLLLVLVGLAVSFLTVRVVLRATRSFLHLLSSRSSSLLRAARFAATAGLAVTGFVGALFLFGIALQLSTAADFKLHLPSLASVSWPLLVATLSTAFAVQASVLLRRRFPARLASFDRQSQYIFLALATTQLFAQRLIATFALVLLQVLPRHEVIGDLAWLLSELVLLAPLALLLTLVFQERVPSPEIKQHQSWGSSGLDMLKLSFWPRLCLDYGFVLLFTFCAAWNHGTLASIIAADSSLSEKVAVQILNKLLTFKAEEWTEAAALSLLQLAPLVLLGLSWTYLTTKSHRNEASA